MHFKSKLKIIEYILDLFQYLCPIQSSILKYLTLSRLQLLSCIIYPVFFMDILD